MREKMCQGEGKGNTEGREGRVRVHPQDEGKRVGNESSECLLSTRMHYSISLSLSLSLNLFFSLPLSPSLSLSISLSSLSQTHRHMAERRARRRAGVYARV